MQGSSISRRCTALHFFLCVSHFVALSTPPSPSPYCLVLIARQVKANIAQTRLSARPVPHFPQLNSALLSLFKFVSTKREKSFYYLETKKAKRGEREKKNWKNYKYTSI